MDNSQMTVQQSDEEIEIDLVGILIDLWRKLPLILLVAALCAVIGFVYSSFFITPMYKSSTSMYVLNTTDESKTTYSDLQFSSLLTNDYQEMIKSRYVLETVIENLGLNMSAAMLSNEISIDNPDSTRIITITVKDASPVNAMQIADNVREISSEQIKSVMNIEAVNVVDYANLPTTKCEPSIGKYTMLGGVMGLVLMCAIFALRFILNDAIRTPDDVEKKLGISCLAVVPVNPNIKIRKKNKFRLI